MRYLLFVISVAVCTLGYAQKDRQYIRDSFKLYNDSLFEQAQDASAKAMSINPDSYEAGYNYANALFKQAKYDEALEKYNQLAASETDKTKLGELYHNIGNCHFAKQEFDKSVDSYKKALRNNSADDETRYNLVAAKKMLDQNKNNNQNQDKNQDKNQQQQNQQQQNEEQNQNQNQNQENEQQQQQDQMSREDAERLLNALQAEENKLQEERKKAVEAKRRNIEKNW